MIKKPKEQKGAVLPSPPHAIHTFLDTIPNLMKSLLTSYKCKTALIILNPINHWCSFDMTIPISSDLLTIT